MKVASFSAKSFDVISFAFEIAEDLRWDWNWTKDVHLHRNLYKRFRISMPGSKANMNALVLNIKTKYSMQYDSPDDF